MYSRAVLLFFVDFVSSVSFRRQKARPKAADWTRIF